MALDWLKEKWNGATETITNYYSAYENNKYNGPEFTMEMRKKCISHGPIDSLAYRTCLTNQLLLKNPSAIIAIGGTGKAVLSKAAKSFVPKILQKAAPKAAPVIKNLPGYIQSLVKKEVGNIVTPKGIAAVSPLLKTTFGKVLAIGGLATGAALAVTNSLDFYNWNGPIQTALKNKFPWLYPVNPKTGKPTEYPKIKKMTPAETRQLQDMIYQATGQMLSGEQLRQAIQEKFGITVIEEQPRKGEAAGPLGTGTYTSFQTSVKGSVEKYNIKALPQLMIETPDQLQEATMNEVAAFIQALPGRMSFDYIIKPTYVDADGRRRKGNFAVVKVSIINKKGTATEVAELPLGTVPGNIGTPTPLDGANVAKNIKDALSTSLKGTLLANNSATGSKKPSSKGLTGVDNSQKFSALLARYLKRKEDKLAPIPGTIQVGHFAVEKDWLAMGNPLAGHGGAAMLYFDPKNPTLRFTLEKDKIALINLLGEFLEDPSKGMASYQDLIKYFPDKNDERGVFKALFDEPSIGALERKQRMNDLEAEIELGRLTPQQAEILANAKVL